MEPAGPDRDPSPYEPETLEPYWQRRWEEARCFESLGDGSRPRFFNFDGGPFPNGPLHMGHVRTFTLGDVMARYQRMRGRDVLYCLEFDAFGLPNELAARERGVSPEELTRANIELISGQMRAMGLSYDWRHVHVTCDPKYYRWTQWLFLKLHEAGLIYRAPALLNWCPRCETTLANMQVEDRRCWRCDGRVEQRPLTQWFVRLEQYSDVLFESLSELDGWSDPVRHLLRGFIGPTRGVEIDFEVVGRPDRRLTAFVTEERGPERIAALALDPEHPILDELLAERPRARQEMERFVAELRAVPRKPKRRRDEGDDPEPVAADTGIRCRHPVTGAEVPVYAASFVDPHFATGVEVIDPSPTAGQSRDRDLAERFRLDGGKPVRSWPPERLRRALHFRVRDWLVSRQRSWGTPIPMILCESCGVVPVPAEDLPIELPADLFTPADPERGYGLAGHPDFPDVPCPRCQRPARRETDTLDCYFDVIWCFLACATRLDDDFRFRPQDFHRWMPVDWFHNGMDSFFYAHLYRFLGRVLYDLGFLEEPEPMRRYHGHDAVLRDGRKMSKHHGNVVAPDEILASHGADVLRVHVLWSANPLKSVEWSAEHLERARRFLLSVWDLVVPTAGVVREGFQGWELPPVKGAAAGLARFLRRTAQRVTVFLEDYRYNACLEELNVLLKRMRSFARQRFGAHDDGTPREVGAGAIGDRVPREDAAVFAAAVRCVVLQLTPFAPHLGEELWHRIGGEGLAATAHWPPAPTLPRRAGGGR